MNQKVSFVEVGKASCSDLQGARTVDYSCNWKCGSVEISPEVLVYPCLYM